MVISPRNKRKFLKILNSVMVENNLLEEWEEAYTDEERFAFANMVLETVVVTVTVTVKV